MDRDTTHGVMLFLFKNRFRQDKVKESRRLPDQLPHENQLHVRASEEDAHARDLRSDFVSLDQGGRGARPWDAFFILCPRTGQRAGAHRVGGQPHGTADRRQGEGGRVEPPQHFLTHPVHLYYIIYMYKSYTTPGRNHRIVPSAGRDAPSVP